MSTRRDLGGFQKPLDRGTRRKVKIAVIRTTETEDGTRIVTCSCGRPFLHRRDKAREKAIAAHVDRRHGGQAMWL